MQSNQRPPRRNRNEPLEINTLEGRVPCCPLSPPPLRWPPCIGSSPLYGKTDKSDMKSVHATADISANSQAVIGLALKQGGYLNLLRKRLKGLRCHHRFLSVFPFDQSELEPSDSSAAVSSD